MCRWVFYWWRSRFKHYHSFGLPAFKNLKTFTIGFNGNSKMDESRYAGLIATELLNHVQLNANPDDFGIFTKACKGSKQTIIDSSVFPMFLVSELVSEHCTVVLGGDGSDEIFGDITVSDFTTCRK